MRHIRQRQLPFISAFALALYFIQGSGAGKEIKALLELAIRERPEAAGVPPERIAHMSLPEELDSAGFIDRLYE